MFSRCEQGAAMQTEQADASRSYLIQQNTAVIDQALSVLAALNSIRYRHPLEGAGADSSLGKHFRHIINFYENLCAADSQGMDYDKRLRDPLIEQDPKHAANRLSLLKETLESWDRGSLPLCPKIKIGSQGDEELYIDTNIQRELKFVLEHTIHHFAIIGLILRKDGYDLPEHFGVAPSTIAHHTD